MSQSCRICSKFPAKSEFTWRCGDGNFPGRWRPLQGHFPGRCSADARCTRASHCFAFALQCADLNEIFLQGLVNTLVTIIRHASNQSVPKAAWCSPALRMSQNPSGIDRMCVNGSS